MVQGCLFGEAAPYRYWSFNREPVTEPSEEAVVQIGQLRGKLLSLQCMFIEQLSQRGDGGSGDDDANDGGDTAVHKQKP
jgi:hypothetical protein